MGLPAAFEAAVAADACGSSGCLMAAIKAWPLPACWGPFAGNVCTRKLPVSQCAKNVLRLMQHTHTINAE